MEFSDPFREEWYDLFASYYNDPQMVKIRNQGDYSMYGVRLPCFLLNESRYLIVLCPVDVYEVHTKRPIRDLRWLSLQARSLHEEGLTHLPTHTYSIKRGRKYEIPLRMIHRTETATTYTTTPESIHVALLHTRKNNEYEYSQEGNLVSALETFQTVITWSS